MTILETQNLTKLFARGKITALDDVTLSVDEGHIFGLLGPNGAGKTTLIKILLGILFPTSGSARLLNQPINNVDVKEKLGYLPENHRYPDFFKGGELLDYYAQLSAVDKERRISNKAELLKLVRLEKWEHTKIKKYSKGMQQRLGLAQAMMNDPDILFLDEPTDGVDPIGRKEIRDILLHFKEEGKTIFLNSHLLSEVEMICDEVAILDKGKLIRRGTVAELTSESKSFRIDISKMPENIIEEIKALVLNLDQQNGYIQVTVSSHKKLNSLIDLLRKNNIEIRSVIPHRQSLEDSFIEILKKDIIE